MIDQETLKRFDKLYNDSYSDVSKYIVCNCSNIEDVKDIIQNTYLEVIKNVKRVNSKSYIIGIAKNKLKDYYRFNYKAKVVSLFSSKENSELIDNIKSDIDLEKSFLIKYDTELVWNYLKKKKTIISKIFYLYYFLELSIIEIANELNITESSVKNHLYRTLKELKSMLERSDYNV